MYFTDPLGLLIELSCYKFEPPAGATFAAVLMEAHKLRVAGGAREIGETHLADAIEALAKLGTRSLSTDRSAKNPYQA